MIMLKFLRAPLLSIALIGFVASAPALAQEAKPTGAESRAVVQEKSIAVNKAASPEEANTIAQGEEAADPALTDEEAADAYSRITAYDPAKVKGRAKEWQVYYQPAASPVMEHLEGLHDFVTWIAVVITVLVMGLLAYVAVRFREGRNPVPHRFAHNTVVEIAWTVIPILILVAIAIPSVRAHYEYTNNQEIIDNPDLTLKVVGNQWYWNYEYPEFGIKYDSNIVPEEKLKDGQPRLLTVDNPVVVPVGKVVRVQMTSADVIHNWAMPSMGVKQDTVPGKLSETWFLAKEEGIYYGQCSELCGKFHGFMPIEIHVVSEEDFNAWVQGAKLKFAADGSRQFAALN